uniref:Dienelactone hydrolase domain-containing protein n=1 Tax=Panagrolaimus sp. JU765 TaxID=591449 RepID=A0AC34RSV9_9BILA
MTGQIIKKRVEYTDSEGTVLEGFLVYPAEFETSGKKYPVVTVHHAFAGITEFEEEKTESLAKLGYVGFAADVYGKGVKGETREECFALLKSILAE